MSPIFFEHRSDRQNNVLEKSLCSTNIKILAQVSMFQCCHYGNSKRNEAKKKFWLTLKLLFEQFVFVLL